MWKAHEEEDQVQDGPEDAEDNTNSTIQSLRMDGRDQEGEVQFSRRFINIEH